MASISGGGVAGNSLSLALVVAIHPALIVLILVAVRSAARTVHWVGILCPGDGCENGQMRSFARFQHLRGAAGGDRLTLNPRGMARESRAAGAARQKGTSW
jgi:hypothetical protein